MHTCPPPHDNLEVWLSADGSIKGGNYGHLLLEQQTPKDELLLAALRTYFESAHLDAREHFHHQIGISLHPDGNVSPVVAYPTCLPNKALRGLFGEVMAGLVTEAYKQEFVGGHDWQIPIFLFREHDDVEKYLWNLRDDPDRTREIYGRHGTDFVAISLNDVGDVERVIAGEAKWRKTLTDSVVATMLLGPKKENAETGAMEHTGKGIWYELNRDTQIPHGLRQLQRLLEKRDPDTYAAAIVSIDRAVLKLGAPPERTDLVVICGNGAARRDKSDVLIGWEEPPVEYTAGRDLQVVELILDDGSDLIEELYASLWDGD